MTVTEIKVRVAFIKVGGSYLTEINEKNPGGCAVEFSMNRGLAMQFANKQTAYAVREVLEREGYFDAPGGAFKPYVVEEETGVAVSL